MARGFRILHLADSHIGADLPARPRSNRPRRGDDFIASYRQVLATAERDDVDLVVHAGDVFDQPDVTDTALAAASQPLLQLATAGIPVVIVPGNHERSALPASLLLSHPNLHVVREPATLCLALRGVRVAVAALPCIRRSAARRFADALADTRWRQARAEVRILVAHQTFESATCGPAGYRFRSGDDVVERDAVPAEFHYVAAGHIHRHQVLDTPHEHGPPIVYAGSCDRISLAERDEPKGAVLVEHVGDRLAFAFQEHAVRSMVLVPIDVSGRNQAQIRTDVCQRLGALPPGAVAHVRLTGESTWRALRGLDLARRARAARPDLMLSISAQAIEKVPERRVVCRATGGNTSTRAETAFAELNASGDGVCVCSTAERKSLPAGCGTYALCDAQGRVLYVGKAKNVRARIAAHLSPRNAGGPFAGWAREVARVQVRQASCELEALLVEAELIRRHQPPFNRQMRLWSRYCYLCENGKPHGQLHPCREPTPDGVCFGPYRSRRMAQEVLEAAATFFRLALCPAGEPPRHGSRRLGAPDGARLCARYFAGECSVRAPAATASRPMPRACANVMRCCVDTRTRHWSQRSSSSSSLMRARQTMPDYASACRLRACCGQRSSAVLCCGKRKRWSAHCCCCPGRHPPERQSCSGRPASSWTRSTATRRTMTARWRAGKRWRRNCKPLGPSPCQRPSRTHSAPQPARCVATGVSACA